MARLVIASPVRALVVRTRGLRLCPPLRPWVLGRRLARPLAALALQALATYGLGLLVAPAATLFPDSGQPSSPLLTLLTFASPILYPEAMAAGALRAILTYNPFTDLLRLYRGPILPLAGAPCLAHLGVAAARRSPRSPGGLTAQGHLWWKARDRL